ncbi:Las1-domain-containing protein [Clathrospora elynae]|uniref:Las1-domain-containing protein n=1 Tax=Clathrospora elynae TaxID=706981 RepID=A0A6A5S981_9PLEO|nr:Las1-domain-containing protein [Clathrospora elynae]
MELHTQFVVTAWRNSQELLQLRQDLYSSDTSRREKAVSKVFAWRLRKPDGLPLLLDSTADIVDVLLQDQRDGLKHNALRLLYATAISRFITGLADTQIELTRDRPSWFPPGKSLQLPLILLEIRHRIVHRHLPSLAELKRAATESLEWLWEWYWGQLDHAFKAAQPVGEALVVVHGQDMGVVESQDTVLEKLQILLKTYVKERKSEIKSRKQYKESIIRSSGNSKAAETASSTYKLRFSNNSTTTPSTQTQRLLLKMLVDDRMMLPTDKKMGSTMSGAFLIWTPFLLAFSSVVLPASTLLDHLLGAMNAPSTCHTTGNPEHDPIREGLRDWGLHILTSDSWTSALGPAGKTLTETILAQCFSEPTFWNLKLAAALLDEKNAPNRELWRAVLDAVRTEDGVGEDMHVDVDVDVESIEQGIPVSTKQQNHIEGVEEKEKEKEKEKIKGPQKVLGMWKPRPIGWMPEGWEEDE